MQTLQEIFIGQPDIVGQQLQSVTVVNKSPVTVSSIPGIQAKITYRLRGQPWVAENVTLLSSKQIVYLIEARFPEEETKTFETVFKHIVVSFQPSCEY